MQDLHRLLTEHLGFVVLHPAFPEISLPIKRSLRRTIKSSRVGSILTAEDFACLADSLFLVYVLSCCSDASVPLLGKE